MEEIGWRMEDGGSRMEDRELNVERDPSIRYPLVSLSSISQLILYPPSSILDSVFQRFSRRIDPSPVFKESNLPPPLIWP